MHTLPLALRMIPIGRKVTRVPPARAFHQLVVEILVQYLSAEVALPRRSGPPLLERSQTVDVAVGRARDAAEIEISDPVSQEVNRTGIQPVSDGLSVARV